jgi:hypothetical protein
MTKELSPLVVAMSLLGFSMLAYADELPPGLEQAIKDPDIPMIIDATIIKYNKKGHAEIRVNTAYKKGYTKDYKPRSTVSIRNPIEELRSDKVRIPTSVRGYGYDMKGDKVAKMSIIMPRGKTRFLFFLSGDLLYSTYNNRFEIREDEDGRLLVDAGNGSAWKPLSDIVRLIPQAVEPTAPNGQ